MKFLPKPLNPVYAKATEAYRNAEQLGRTEALLREFLKWLERLI